MKTHSTLGILVILAAAAIAAFSTAEAFAADVNHGKQLYMTCAACHGATGAGNEALGAPPIGGLPAWYTARQLNNFRPASAVATRRIRSASRWRLWP
ncbi:c-type cytochrome [Methyloceanibacter methanicus]|uniref:c-type cytochrome n=1 Tax=Methyloceanibacter methanicus TaxID=1774968 RepID=UPI0009F2E00F